MCVYIYMYIFLELFYRFVNVNSATDNFGDSYECQLHNSSRDFCDILFLINVASA